MGEGGPFDIFLDFGLKSHSSARHASSNSKKAIYYNLSAKQMPTFQYLKMGLSRQLQRVFFIFFTIKNVINIISLFSFITVLFEHPKLNRLKVFLLKMILFSLFCSKNIQIFALNCHFLCWFQKLHLVTARCQRHHMSSYLHWYTLILCIQGENDRNWQNANTSCLWFVCHCLKNGQAERIWERKTELERESKEKAKDFNQMLWFDVGWQPVSMHSCCSYVVRAAPSTLQTPTLPPLTPSKYISTPSRFVITADSESCFLR